MPSKAVRMIILKNPINVSKFLEIVQSTFATKARKGFTSTQGIHAKIEQAKQFIGT